jgi:hypothetical protein
MRLGFFTLTDGWGWSRGGVTICVDGRPGATPERDWPEEAAASENSFCLSRLAAVRKVGAIVVASIRIFFPGFKVPELMSKSQSLKLVPEAMK